jgi:hypothetical protein
VAVERPRDGYTLHSRIVWENLPYIVGAWWILVDKGDAQLLWSGFNRKAQIERGSRLGQL